MPNRRESIHEFYRRLPGAQVLLEKSAASAPLFPFLGPAVEHAIVVRTDLNGYSDWARTKTAGQRAEQLDAFFSSAVPLIEAAGGVFFRDEGDCIVSLFSRYLARTATYDSIEAFCMRVSGKLYGPAQLSAKTCVACGDVAFFQKKHEVASGDWSAEGEPFVKAARLEAAVASQMQITFFAKDYDAFFANTSNVAAPGGQSTWDVRRESLQVGGLGAVGGWVDVVRLARRAAG